MAILASVNVGMPRDVTWNRRTVYTGAWKQPVSGPRMVRRLNVDGDGQGDLAGHGGENRAVLVYQVDSYQHWARVLDRQDLAPGLLGRTSPSTDCPMTRYASVTDSRSGRQSWK